MRCRCVKYFPSGTELLDDDVFVYTPHKVGEGIQLFGKKNSRFPYQLFVGPDWRCMCMTYALLIIPTILFINNIAVIWGPVVVAITVLLLLVTLCLFSATACTDPGIVFVKPAPPAPSTEMCVPVASRSGAGTTANAAANRQRLANSSLPVASSENSQHGSDSAESESNDSDALVHGRGKIPKNSSDSSSISSSNTSTANIAKANVAAAGSRYISPVNRPTVDGDLRSRNSAGSAIPSNIETRQEDDIESQHQHQAQVHPQQVNRAYVPPDRMQSHMQQRRFARQQAANASTIQCGHCHIERPRNAYHCYDCGVCVLDEDHHCPWTGKCIGKKNILTFHWFLFFLTALIGYVVVLVVITASHGEPLFDLTPKD